MAPNVPPHSHDASASAGGDDVVSRIYLIRHGDRFDYANPSWLDSARDQGALVTDPPLSALGHRQARETADHLSELTKGNGDDEGHHVDEILVSPYLRVIQTAVPTSDALGLPLNVESGLSEAHATPGSVLPTPGARFAYFPQINPLRTSSLLDVQPTPGYNCPKTGHPCEAFAGEYCRRMGQFASTLERTYHGRSVVLFSHAASVALVAALLRCSMRKLKFAPCGVYRLERRGMGPWTMVGSGHDNSAYVKENSPTTYPWGFDDKHFDESLAGKGYFGSSVGIDLDYFEEN